MRQRPITAQVKRRIQFILMVAATAYAVLFGRLAWIQLYKGAELESKAFENRFSQITVEAQRGAIYDAKGRPLAISIMTDTVTANPKEVIKSGRADEIVAQLAEILELDREELAKKVNDNAERWFIYVKRKITEEQAQAVRACKLPGVSFLEEPMRMYPKGELLANFLGFVGTDNIGLSGLEISYDDVLSGTAGKRMMEQDHRGLSIPASVQKFIPSQDGASIVLTIDETIQYILEREIAEAVERYHPDKMGILMMEPQTGRVLGMAQYPTFDPNSFSEFSQKEWRNFLISDVYEPGSTFKTVVMAGAIEEGAVSLDDQFYCSGAVKLTAGTIRCWRGLPHGHQSFIEGVQNSCNPMFVNVGLNLGKEAFYKYLYGFGFGKKTGIELAGEATGILVPQKDCRELDIGSMSIGQSNAVTPIQLLSAFCAITNGGTLMKPQIVKEILDADGRVIRTIEPEAIRQVISPATSAQVLEALETVVSAGTGKTAFIDGYRVGGKTGTAQKVIPGVGYSQTESVVSFLGVAPVNDPQIVCLVLMDNPKGYSLTGGATCGPIFQAAAKDILTYLQVPTQMEPERLYTPSLERITLRDYTGISVAEAEALAVSQGITTTVVGSGTQVYGQIPSENSVMLKGGNLALYTELPKSLNQGPRQIPVPDLTGKTAEEAAAIAEEYDLHFEMSGAGEVIYQQPSPGMMVEEGSRVVTWLEEAQNSIPEDVAGP